MEAARRYILRAGIQAGAARAADGAQAQRTAQWYYFAAESPIRISANCVLDYEGRSRGACAMDPTNAGNTPPREQTAAAARGIS